MEKEIFEIKIKQIIDSFNEVFRGCTIGESYKIIAYAMSIVIKQDADTNEYEQGIKQLSFLLQLKMLEKFTDMIKEEIYKQNKQNKLK